MEVSHWIGAHWLDLVQTVGIVAGLYFTARAFHLDITTRRVDHLIEITNQHREIWTELYSRPELSRIRETTANLQQEPITAEEELFISLLILHLNVSFHAITESVFAKPDGLRADIRRFFSRPLAKLVWDKMKPFQDQKFVAFVEDCQKNK